MEQKKTAKADLENKKNIFFLFGLVLSLGIALAAFEWTSKPAKVESLGSLKTQDVEEEFIPITREPEVQPPPPPLPKVVEILTIVDDDVKIEEELVIEDSEADDNTMIDINPVIANFEEEKDVKTEEIFYILEDPAEFPGGERALYKYISDNVKYPVIAQENGIQGKVYVKFVVNEQGDVTNAEILRGVDSNLDREALRVINSLPKFKPGKQRGRSVKQYYNALITFQLQ